MQDRKKCVHIFFPDNMEIPATWIAKHKIGCKQQRDTNLTVKSEDNLSSPASISAVSRLCQYPCSEDVVFLSPL